MPKSIKTGLESAIVTSAKVVAQAQTQVDRVLWGKKAMIFTYQVKESSSIQVDAQARNANQIYTNNLKSYNPLDYGLFPVLDMLNSVDVCNILNYILAQNGAKIPNYQNRTGSTYLEKKLFFIQSQSYEVQKFIDEYTATPNQIITKYTGLGYATTVSAEADSSMGITPSQGIATPGAAPAIPTGTDVQKFNLANLVIYIRSALADGTSLNENGKSIFGSEDQTLLQNVPQLDIALNAMNDYINTLNGYADYRNISNEDLQKGLKKLDELRGVCVLIQTLNFRDPLGFANAFRILPPTDLLAQAQKVQEWINPQQIMPTVKKINDACKAFMKVVNRLQGVITQSRFIIKLSLLLIKIFKFIVKFLKKLPVPNVFTSLGISNTMSSICSSIESFIKFLEETLEQLNSLLTVITFFVDYVKANTQELIKRLDILLSNLNNCDLQKDSPIVKQANDTKDQLNQLNAELETYIQNYNNKVKEQEESTQNVGGRYSIRVVDEEVIDKTIINKRRRGIALDNNGVIVAQSDLTFATNKAVIVEEVRRKLRSMGLIEPGTNALSIEAGITAFLDDDTINQTDLTLDTEDAEDPENEDEEQGLGLQAFVNKLRGGKRLRRRTRMRLAKARKQLQQQIGSQGEKAASSLGISRAGSSVAPPGNFQTYEVVIYKPTPPVPGTPSKPTAVYDPITKKYITTTTPVTIQQVRVFAISLADAVKAAKEKVDEDNKNPTWKYVPRLVK